MSDFFPPETETTAGPQVTPHSRDAEEAVLGAVMINPEVYYDVAEFLRPDDFYIHRNRWIWEAFTRLHDQRIPIDFLTVSEALENSGQLAEVGGPAYLTALINNVPTTLHTVAYGHMVEAAATRRRMITAANEIAKIAYQEDLSVTTILDEAEKQIFGLSDRHGARGAQHIKPVLKEYQDRLEMLLNKESDILGVPTGFIDLDKMLNGLNPSDLLILAGRPGTGKTAFMLSIARHAALRSQKHIAIFSMEMSNEQLVQRLLAQETGINSQKIRTGKLDDRELQLLLEAMKVFEGSMIFMDDTPGLTPTQLATKCRRLHLEHKIDLIVLDYLQLMSGGTRTDNRVQEVSYISRNLKILAKQLEIPILAAAQLSRAVEQRADKKPMLSDLRESGSLEQDADIVMFIYRPEQYEKDTTKENVAEIIISKHRNGPVGSVELLFRPNLARFENALSQNVDTSQMR